MATVKELWEHFAGNGMVYGAVETEEDVLSKSIRIDSGAEEVCISQGRSKIIRPGSSL